MLSHTVDFPDIRRKSRQFKGVPELRKSAGIYKLVEIGIIVAFFKARYRETDALY